MQPAIAELAPGRPALTLGQLAIIPMFLAAAFGVYWLANRPLAVEPAVDPSTISESNAATVADAIRGIPNIAISYYSIQATDEAGIRKELYLKGPRTEGERFGALTEWYFSWHWEPGLDGSCGTGNASVMFSAAITLPRLANPQALTPEVAEAWQSYMTALIHHEANHARHAYDGSESVADAIRSHSCSDANLAAKRVVAKIESGEDAYDRRTDHGADEGAVFRPMSRGFLSRLF